MTNQNSSERISKFNSISTINEDARFEKHLNDKSNVRIIFSGIFGIGKTYFIENFFNQHTSKFEFIKLNPVHYAVNSNEDIFELIKFDIAFQLLSKGVEFDKTTFNWSLLTHQYLLKNYKEVIQNLLQNLSKIDHTAESIVSPVLKLINDLQSYGKEINIDEEAKLIEFLKLFKDIKGTIREENDVSVLLQVLLASLKKENKEIILIIDDLDRIDPEHIFRLLNVFSAHFDFQELEHENKFGFDKVILICDIDNIRGIFHSKYGSNTDFSGYIDKFYSAEIFHYNISDEIKLKITDFLFSIKTNNQRFKQHLQVSSSYIKGDLNFMLGYFLKCNALNLRRLFSFLKTEVKFDEYIIKTPVKNGAIINSTEIPVLYVLDTLEKIFGGKHNFINSIDKVIEMYPLISLEVYGNYTINSIGNLAMIASHTLNNFERNSKNATTFHNYIIDGFDIEFEINDASFDSGLVSHLRKINSNYDNNMILPYFQLLKEAVIAKEKIVKKYY